MKKSIESKGARRGRHDSQSDSDEDSGARTRLPARSRRDDGDGRRYVDGNGDKKHAGGGGFGNHDDDDDDDDRRRVYGNKATAIGARQRVNAERGNKAGLARNRMRMAGSDSSGDESDIALV